jgi:putative acetyltransferase
METHDRTRAHLRSVIRSLGVLQARYPELGLGVSQCHALLELRGRDLSLGELAGLLKVDLSTASRNLGTLERHGLVRSRRDGTDPRRKLHRLSARGRAKVGAINLRGDRVLERAFQYLSPGERALVERGLASFAKALERSGGAAEVAIRESRRGDNAGIAAAIRRVLEELGQDKPGTAYHEPQTLRIHDTYRRAKGVYLVMTAADGQVLGGAGIYPHTRTVCELKNMYFLPELRGKGHARRLMNLLLARAAARGFREIFLETFSGWKPAIALYESFGFQRCERPSFYKGHPLCNLYYRRALGPPRT